VASSSLERAELPLTARRTFDAPLTVGALSDTHIWRAGRRTLPVEILSLFQRCGAGLILHAGDINDESVIDQLSAVAPVIGVKGNNDVPELQRSLALREIIVVGPHRIGLVHGHGGRSARDVAFASFDEDIPFVVYGHSHIPKIERRGRTVFFNPGSATDRRWGPHFGVGLLRVTDAKIDPDLILYTRPGDLDSVTLCGMDQDG
jgi:uncharacterized protein